MGTSKFPCSVCAKDCAIDSIFCDTCKSWSHRICCQMSKVDLESWKQRNLKFACMTCARIGDEYNYKAALGRYVILYHSFQQIRT